MNSSVRRHIVLSAKEKLDLLVTSIVIGIIVFFFYWSRTPYDFASGLGAAALIILCSFLVMTLFVGVGKYLALRRAYKALYYRWNTGLMIGLGLGFISQGIIPMVFPGFIELERIKRLAHGETYTGENRADIFYVLAGTLWVLMLAAMFFLFLVQQTGFLVFEYFTVIISLICIFSVLPLRSNIGIHLFYVARKKYYILAIMSVVFGILTLIGLFYALIIAAILGLILGTLAKRNVIETG